MVVPVNWSSRAFGAGQALWVAWVLWALPALALLSCTSQEAIVLTARTPAGDQVRAYALEVQERQSRSVVYRSGVQFLDPAGQKPRDLSAAPLRLGLVLERAGTYLLHLRAGDRLDPARPEAEYFFAAVLTTSGTMEVEAPLVQVPPALDQDGDHFPEATAFAALPGAAGLYRDHPEVLDCVDRDPAPGEPPLPGGLHAADINPLAQERCGLPLDVTCSGRAQSCVDADGDGDPAGSDCDDHDPRRFHGNPRPRNCCICGDPQSCATNHGKLPAAFCTPPRCDSDFDYDCTGVAVDCFRDDDCDGYSPDDPVPEQRDCDDHDPNVHPGAAKNCADPSKDWACDGNPQGGCVDCDLDGDGYQRHDAMGAPGAHCPDKNDLHPGMVDCDDTDRGVFPGANRSGGATLIVRDLNGQAGGTVAGALRGLCRNTTPAGAPQDANCDGDPRKGCPSAACDKDGDGFPNASPGCNPTNLPVDCDDNDPQTFPGAPDNCKDGKAQNCSTPLPCTDDKDGDGYNADVDCDDNDPGVHPWAKEACNGKDDDCDGLIDELNPDAGGNRLVAVPKGKTQPGVLSCTDSNLGECGRTLPSGAFTGACVCSAIVPSTHPNLNSRTACPDTRADATVAPKCFFAQQPVPEVCNGKDDDCDGVVPGVGSPAVLPTGDEADHDGDKYMACTGCSGLSLASGLKGCADCNDLDPSIYPGAKELCDGKDNDCVGAAFVDGKDDCKTGTAHTCCEDPPQCLDTQTSFANCGGCKKACKSATADQCVGGACQCAGMAACSGTTPLCKAGSGCVQCLADHNCPAATPRCSPANTCVQCLMDNDCPMATPKCNPMTDACVQCLTNGDCPMATPFCNPMDVCVQCLKDSDCPMATPKCMAGTCM